MNSTNVPPITGDGTAARPMLLNGNGRPLKPGHNLDRHHGQFRLRVTVDSGRHYSGHRITLPLGTHDRQLAERLRDTALQALALAGVLARHIQFDEPEEPSPMDANYISRQR